MTRMRLEMEMEMIIVMRRRRRLSQLCGLAHRKAVRSSLIALVEGNILFYFYLIYLSPFLDIDHLHTMPLSLAVA